MSAAEEAKADLEAAERFKADLQPSLESFKDRILALEAQLAGDSEQAQAQARRACLHALAALSGDVCCCHCWKLKFWGRGSQQVSSGTVLCQCSEYVSAMLVLYDPSKALRCALPVYFSGRRTRC